MNERKINVPKTYEEAVIRKEEVLSLINEYNEAYFKGEKPRLSEHEIDLLQEEYQILNDIVIEKPLDEIHDDKAVNKINVLDQINPLIWVYGVVILIFSSWFMIEYIGGQVILFIVEKKLFINSENKFFLKMVVFWSFYLFPVLIFGLNFLVRLFFRKNKINNRAFWWVIYVHLIYLIITFVIFYFINLHSFLFS